MKKFAAGAVLVAGSMAEDPVIHPPQQVPEGWELNGNAAGTSGSMDVLVGLNCSNLDKFQQAFEQSTTPDSPGYLEHLSWEEMGNLIRPSDEAIGACWRIGCP